MPDDIKKDKHPSYGLLEFNRCQGGQHNLFGSSIKHSNTITMYLRAACVERHLNTDFYYTDGLIAEIEMSQAQFAEAITSMNTSPGVPVTIKYLRHEGKIESCPFVDKRDQFEQELDQNIKSANTDINDIIKNVQEMFNTKKALTIKEKQQIINQLSALHSKINGNRSFIYNTFNEQMDKTVSEAKGEIEAFMQNKMLAIANNALIEKHNDTLETSENISIAIPDKYDSYYKKYRTAFINTIPEKVYNETLEEYKLNDVIPYDMTFNDYIITHGFTRNYEGFVSLEKFKQLHVIKINDDTRDFETYLKNQNYGKNLLLKISENEYVCDTLGVDVDNIITIIF